MVVVTLADVAQVMIRTRFLALTRIARHTHGILIGFGLQQVSPRAKHQQSGPPRMHRIDFVCADYELDLVALAAYVYARRNRQ